jgi:hypothetical protein
MIWMGCVQSPWLEIGGAVSLRCAAAAELAGEFNRRAVAALRQLIGTRFPAHIPVALFSGT